MTKTEMIEAVAKQAGLTKKAATGDRHGVAFFKLFRDELADGVERGALLRKDRAPATEAVFFRRLRSACRPCGRSRCCG